MDEPIIDSNSTATHMVHGMGVCREIVSIPEEVQDELGEGALRPVSALPSAMDIRVGQVPDHGRQSAERDGGREVRPPGAPCLAWVDELDRQE